VKDRLDLWAGGFGNDYHNRNGHHRNAMPRCDWLRMVLGYTAGAKSVVEFGCGTGGNLIAFNKIAPDIETSGVEPNEKAAGIASRSLPSKLHASIYISSIAESSFEEDQFDMSLTCGVLIHIPPEGLPETMAKIHRVTKRYILCAEYFAPSEEVVPYRGEEAALWRRDYGSLWMKQFPDLKYITHGFLWKPVDGLDNLTWWLFEKWGG
jgi:pseudaminic acid biosynthesis-associated methylase